MSTKEFNYTREWTDAEAFPLLSFTKNWENPDDYPTIETDEQKVRQDMQSLHDEVKDFLNNELIPRVVLEDATVDAWTASEDTRVANEAERVAQEQARASAEQARVEVEASRVTTETARANAESARVVAEQGRVTAEESRNANEANRVATESARVTAESARATVEANRVTAESGRESAEAVRVANETERISAEQDRKSAEEIRVEHENQRIENNNTLVQTTKDAREAIDSVEKLDADWVELPAGSPVYVEKSVNAEGGIQLTFGLSRGTSGVYVGSGTMPDDANIQIDPTGDPTDTAGLMMAKTYDPTGKAQDVFAYVDNAVGNIPTPDVTGQYTDLGSFSGKTIADFRTALNSWLVKNVGVPNEKCKFTISQRWVDNWNAENTTTAMPGGYVHTAEVLAAHSANSVQIQIMSYNTNDIYYTARASGTWLPVVKNATVSEIETHNTDAEAHADIREAVATKAPMYTYGTTDLTAGSSPLASGQLHFVYE